MRTFEAEWDATLATDSPGYGVALAPAAGETTVADWVEPSVPGILAVGFDVLEPATKNPFDANGNIFDRPQRQVSLHWNGVEVANRLCPAEMRPGHRAKWRVEPVIGGVAVSVWVGGKAVYDNYFVPGVAFSGEPRFLSGGMGAELKTRGKPRWSGKWTPLAIPVHVRAFDKERNDKAHHRATQEVTFPESINGVGRVVCTLTLEATPEGIDPWDRLAQIFLYDEKGERFEILRYITPYRKGWTWKMDVTDLMPLLVGKRKMEMFCETWAEGWLVSVDFDFYPGALKQVPYRVVNLWSGTPVLGDADQPVERFFTPKPLAIDAAAKQAKVRFCVTGHGQAPNTDNAAEFISLWRKLSVSDQTWQDTLWKTDVFLNPCRPQRGTWKYDRAGWAPGDVVTPWLVDITRAVRPGKEATARYEVQPYVNKNTDKGNPARHVVESQLILYK